MSCENCEICKQGVAGEIMNVTTTVFGAFGDAFGEIASSMGVKEKIENPLSHKEHKICPDCGHCIDCYHKV
jgi:hypothetical protein